MDEAHARGETKLSVRHAGGVAPSIPDSHQAEIDRLIEGRTQAAADLHGRIAEAERKALAPLAELVQRDPNAGAAARDLARLKLEAFRQSLKVEGLGGVSFRGPTGPVHPAKPGLNIFGPPYDWQVLSTVGDKAEATSDVGSGRFSAGHRTLSDSLSGRRAATAGVSMALQAVTGGFARIAPVLKYDYWWALDGWNLSAHTEGWCELVVQDGSGSVLPQGHRTVNLWNRTSQTHDSGEGADQVYVPDIETTVALAPGQIFHVTLTGTAVVVDSGGGLFGYSSAVASLDMWAAWFTVTF